MISKIQPYFIFLIILLIVFFYYPIFFYSFSQDDFIHLSSSKVNSLLGVINFFNPLATYPDIFFYRPLATQFWFFINNTLFGYNPTPYHIEALLFHLLNSFLVYKLIYLTWKDKKIALISMLLYGISATHFLSLFYISAFQQILKTTFILISIILTLKYIETKKIKLLILSLISFTAALLSKETSIILPLFLIPFIYLHHENKLKIIDTFNKYIKLLLLFIGIAGFYLLIRIIGIQQIFNQGSYDTTLNPIDILQNLKWLLLWTLGLPEIISTFPSLKTDTLINVYQTFPYAKLIFFSLIIFLITLLPNLFKKTPLKLLVCSFLIFLIPLLPILPLKQHQYPQYLDLSLLGVLPLLSSFLTANKSKLLIYLSIICIISFVLLQWFSLLLSQQTHWTTHRSIVADYYFKTLITKNPILDQNTTVIFQGTDNSTKQLSIALAKHYALKIWYPQNLKSVIYLNSQETIPASTSPLIIPVTKH